MCLKEVSFFDIAKSTQLNKVLPLAKQIDLNEMRPEGFHQNLETGLNKINDSIVFHAGTKIIDGKIYSNGGRVLNFVSVSNGYADARQKTLKMINELNWSNGYYRKDIGYKIIDQ